jgi:hypothetical protein
LQVSESSFLSFGHDVTSCLGEFGAVSSLVVVSTESTHSVVDVLRFEEETVRFRVSNLGAVGADLCAVSVGCVWT